MVTALALKLMLAAAADAPVAVHAAHPVGDPTGDVAVHSYVGLSIEALIEQKRLLREEQPNFILPIVVAVLGLPAVGLGALGLGAGLYQTTGEVNPKLPASTPLFVVGGVLLAVGAAVVTVGLVWLAKVMAARSPITARLEEVESLINLRMRPTTGVPPPPPQPGAPPPLSLAPSSSGGLAFTF